jgi:hypothetical protein
MSVTAKVSLRSHDLELNLGPNLLNNTVTPAPKEPENRLATSCDTVLLAKFVVAQPMKKCPEFIILQL